MFNTSTKLSKIKSLPTVLILFAKLYNSISIVKFVISQLNLIAVIYESGYTLQHCNYQNHKKSVHN